MEYFPPAFVPRPDQLAAAGPEPQDVCGSPIQAQTLPEPRRARSGQRRGDRPGDGDSINET